MAAAAWLALVLLHTVLVDRGFCVSVGAKQDELQKVSPNNDSIKKVFQLLQSLENVLKQKRKVEPDQANRNMSNTMQEENLVNQQQSSNMANVHQNTQEAMNTQQLEHMSHVQHKVIPQQQVSNTSNTQQQQEDIYQQQSSNMGNEIVIPHQPISNMSNAQQQENGMVSNVQQQSISNQEDNPVDDVMSVNV